MIKIFSIVILISWVCFVSCAGKGNRCAPENYTQPDWIINSAVEGKFSGVGCGSLIFSIDENKAREKAIESAAAQIGRQMSVEVASVIQNSNGSLSETYSIHTSKGVITAAIKKTYKDLCRDKIYVWMVTL